MPSGLRRAIEECWRPRSQFMLDRATRDQPACRFIPFPSHQFVVSGRSGVVKGAPSTRRSGPLTARIELQSFGGGNGDFSARARRRPPRTRKIHNVKDIHQPAFLTARRSKHAIRPPGLRCACLPCSTYCQVRLRAPSGSRLLPPPGLRLVLTALSRTSPRRVVRNAG